MNGPLDENLDTSRDIWRIVFRLTDLSSESFRKSPAAANEEQDREACLQRVLRPHDEAGFEDPADQWMVAWRRELDAALGTLTLREIRRELNLTNAPLAPDVQARVQRLFRSEAFLRYVNAYLYFAVRFVPSDPELADVSDATAQTAPANSTVCADSNVPRFPLPAPPAPRGLVPEETEARFDEFARMIRGDRAEPVRTALEFLDDFHERANEKVLYDLREPTAFELWLRGLRPETDGTQKLRFEQIRDGLCNWAIQRANFYFELGRSKHVSVIAREAPLENVEGRRPPEGWLVTHPMAARLGLADVYWIARLFRADVSANGTVSYQKQNWLHLLRFRAVLDRDEAQREQLNRAEEALRSVFDYVCDLIQNSIEITEEQSQGRSSAIKTSAAPENKRDETVTWRIAFDEELDEIANQRRVRHYRDPSLAPEASTGGVPEAETEASSSPEGAGMMPLPPSAEKTATEAQRDAEVHAIDPEHRWSRKILGLPQPANLIGLAFSGGGIRSATLNLGVLQGLQELDLLRHFDYISTVSGGGYIGSWLVGNVRRSAHWLGRLTDWSASIEHLRKYSNYLAPRTGFLSPDTWNIANVWLRNTVLIQLTAIAWLFVLLLTALAGMRIFIYAGGLPWIAPSVAGVAAVMVVVSVFEYLTGLISGSVDPFRQAEWVVAVSHKLPEALGRGVESFARTRWVRIFAVIPAWIGAWSLAAYLWAHATFSNNWWPCLNGAFSLSDLLLQAWKVWWGILAAAAAGFAILGWATLWQKRSATIALHRRIFWTGAICVLCTFVAYLELVSLYDLFRTWSGYGDTANSLGFVFGPSLVLVAFAICVLLLIGLAGRYTDEARREWWTRFGTWLALLALGGVSISGVAVYGPWAVLGFIRWGQQHNSSLTWTPVVTWLGTVIAGLFAGKSEKTGAPGENANAPFLEALAKLGGFLFLAGSFVLGSTLLYVLLFAVFGPDSPVMRSDPRHIFCELAWWVFFLALAVMLAVGCLFSKRFEINIFGLSQFYRNRLVRCYLGATRWAHGARKPNPFTKFDFKDDLPLWRFRTRLPEDALPEEKNCGLYRGPLPVLNCSLNLGGSSDLELNTRHSASFTLTPLRCGSNRPLVGYAPTAGTKKKFADGVPLGQAVAISGAAVSSNMGYNTAPLVAFLLTMFNVRLAWWFPNPGKCNWNARGLNFSLSYLLAELFGTADENRGYVNVSDGGHFENLGIYEMIRRRCRLIVASDAESDPNLQFGSLGRMIRICETDFGALVDLQVQSIRLQPNGLSLAHCAVGTIKYCTGEIGRLIYLKASLTGDEDASIAQYRTEHPSFPHESTANQFYSEDQFESYRRLGLHMVRSSFKGNLPGDDPLLIAERLFDVLTPAGLPPDKFLKHSADLSALWEKFRNAPALTRFFTQLISATETPGEGIAEANDQELCIGLELIQLMEDVFLDLRLDDFWEHPDNRGWAILFMRWARSPIFRSVWKRTRRTFGIRFEYFCHAYLGLERDAVIARV